MKKVTIYTGPFCNYCDAAKRLLARNNTPYNEIDISKVEGAMDETWALEKENKLMDLLK